MAKISGIMIRMIKVAMIRIAGVMAKITRIMIKITKMMTKITEIMIRMTKVRMITKKATATVCVTSHVSSCTCRTYAAQ